MYQRNRVRYIVFCGLFTALSLALKSASLYLFQYLRLGFGLMPVISAGFLLGPLGGLLVGALTDILGYFFFSWGQAYFPGYTLTYALAGFLPALLCYVPCVQGNRRMRVLDLSRKHLPLRILISIGCSQLLNSVLLNTLFLEWTGAGKFVVSILPRFLSQCVLTPIFAMVVLAVLKSYGKYTHQTKFYAKTPF